MRRGATAPLSRLFEVIIALCAVPYAACTVFTTAALGRLNLSNLTKEGLSSGPMLTFLIVQLGYTAVWLVLAGTWLAWYASLLDWARARGAPVPPTLTAIGLWFVPLVNFGHPWATLSTIRQHTGVRTPLDSWWLLFTGSVLVSSFGGVFSGVTRGTAGFSPVQLGATVAELIALLLCWKIVRDFRLADRAWDPRAALTLRDGASAP